jgi:hypothetical protein
MATILEPGAAAADIPQGSAYGRGAQHPDAALTQVSQGAPMGELMRRYWQPVLASRNVTARRRDVRVLGVYLIFFR